MDRRRYLALAAAGILAGCGRADDSPSGSTPTPTATTSTTPPTETPTTTEPTTSTEEPEPAAFELEEYEVPDTVEIKEGFTPSITVRNTGGQPGEYAAPLYYRYADEEEWTEGGEWDFGVIPPGGTETAVAAEPWRFNYLGELELALGDFARTAGVEVTPAERVFGEPFELLGTRFEVNALDLQPTYTADGFRYQAPDGEQFAFLTVRAENISDEPRALPSPSNFSLLEGQNQYSRRLTRRTEERYRAGTVQPGVVREGHIAYTVPEELAPEDLEAVWSLSYPEGAITVFWSL